MEARLRRGCGQSVVPALREARSSLMFALGRLAGLLLPTREDRPVENQHLRATVKTKTQSLKPC